MDHKEVLIYLFLLVGTLNKVLTIKWSHFHTGCATASGRIGHLSNLHLSHCTAECYVNTKCKVFGYSSTNKLCFLFDESFSTSTSGSCSSMTVRFYRDSCSNVTDYTYVASINKCIRYHPSPRLVWDNAKQVCEQDGGHLIYVKRKEVLDYIRTFRETDSKKYWIGGKQSQMGSDKFEWMSGETIDDTNGGQLWLEGQPEINNHTNNYCLQTKLSSDLKYFGFYERSCEISRKFFCELDFF